MEEILTLSLDDLWEEGFYYTEYDIRGRRRSITIKKTDKEKFLDAFAKEWRDRAEKLLEVEEDVE